MSDFKEDLSLLSDLEERSPQAFVVNGWPVILCLNDGTVHALINRCTHAASPLADGRIRKGAISCPLHGARFRLDSGKCLGGADYDDLRVFPVTVNASGFVEVTVPSEMPSQSEQPVV